MKRVLLVCFLFILQLGAESQSSLIDSFRKALAVVRDDTNKVKQLNRLAELEEFTNADTALLLAEHADALANTLRYPPGMAFANLLLSGAYTTLGNYRLALYYSFKCRDLAKEIPIIHLYIRSLSHLMSCYAYLGEVDKALLYARQTVPLVQKYFPGRMSYPYVDLAKCLEAIHDDDSAIYYAKKSLSLYNSATINGDDFVGLDPHAYILSTLAAAYSDKGDYDSALLYFRRSLSTALTANIGVDLVDAYNGMSSVFIKTGHLDSATWYCKKVLAEKMGRYYPLGLLAATETLSRIYRGELKTDSALQYLESATLLKDSLFNREKTAAAENLAFSDQEKEKELEASRLKYKNQFKIFSLAGGLIAALVIAVILFRHNRHRQRAYAQLMEQQAATIRQKMKTEQALSELKSAQAQLIQSEKMASLGELTAGIAHEIQNPLNFVNNFSEVNIELADELKTGLNNSVLPADQKNGLIDIADLITKNQEKINHHGKRADAIVKSMLLHSRSNIGVKEPTDINAFAGEYLRLAYHGVRAKDIDFNSIMRTDFDETIAKINIIPQDIGRVLLNLYNNSFYAVAEKRKQQPSDYEPTVSVSTRKMGDRVEIRVMDNGNGIPQNVVDKIFQPFFTTKPTGIGTGLGLSLSYDIIKAHGGEIKVNTNEGEFTEFLIQIPDN